MPHKVAHEGPKSIAAPAPNRRALKSDRGRLARKPIARNYSTVDIVGAARSLRPGKAAFPVEIYKVKAKIARISTA